MVLGGQAIDSKLSHCHCGRHHYLCLENSLTIVKRYRLNVALRKDAPKHHHPLCVHSRQMGLSESQSLLVTVGSVVLETDEHGCCVEPSWVSCCLSSFNLHGTLTISMFTDKETGSKKGPWPESWSWGNAAIVRNLIHFPLTSFFW